MARPGTLRTRHVLPGSARRAPRALGLVLIVAAALRGLAGLWAAKQPIEMGADAPLYRELAAALADGRLDARLLFVSPLYPHLLAVLPDPGSVVWLQLAGGVASLWALARLAASEGGDARVAVLAAGLAAACGPLLFFELQLFPNSLAVAALLTGLALVAAPTATPIATAGAGLAWALAIWLDPSELLAVAAALFVLRRRGPRTLVLLLVPVAIGALAFGIRNAAIEPGASPFGANSGITLAHGSFPASGDAFGALPGSDGSKRLQHVHARRVAEQALERPLTWREVDAFWRSASLARWIEEPRASATLSARKLGLLLGRDFLPQDTSYRAARALAPGFLLLPVSFLALLALGAVGLAARRSAPPLCAAALLGVAVTNLVFYPSDRYRLPMLALLCIPAAHGLAALWVRGGVVRAVGLSATAALVVASALSQPSAAQLALARSNLAENLERAGRSDEALAIQRELNAQAPGVGRAHALQRLLVARGELEAARAVVEGGLARAPGSAQLHHDRALLLVEAGDTQQARMAFEQALAADAPVPESHLQLARLEEREDGFEAAADHFRAYTRLLPHEWRGWQGLARALHRAGENGDATLGALDEARVRAGSDPVRLASTLNLAGLVREARAEHDEALDLFMLAIETSPGANAARRNLKRVREKVAAGR